MTSIRLTAQFARSGIELNVSNASSRS